MGVDAEPVVVGAAVLVAEAVLVGSAELAAELAALLAALLLVELLGEQAALHCSNSETQVEMLAPGRPRHSFSVVWHLATHWSPPEDAVVVAWVVRVRVVLWSGTLVGVVTVAALLTDLVAAWQPDLHLSSSEAQVEMFAPGMVRHWLSDVSQIFWHWASMTATPGSVAACTDRAMPARTAAVNEYFILSVCSAWEMKWVFFFSQGEQCDGQY